MTPLIKICSVSITLVTLLLIFVVSNAWGDYRLPMPVIKVNFTGVIGANSMSKQTQARAWNDALRQMRGEGIRVVKASQEFRADPYPYFRYDNDGRGLDVLTIEFGNWFKNAGRLGLMKDGQIRHILAPPFDVGGHLYFGGVAFVGSIRGRGFSYSNGLDFNSKGEGRYRHSVNAIKHELGHVIFATHDDSNANVMHSNASNELNKIILGGVGRRLFFNQKAKDEIVRGLR
jgi:hypothetical protein